MLITFHTNAYANLTFFGDVAKTLLHLMGHSGAVPGALCGEEVSHALNNLQKNLEKVGSEKNYDNEEEEPEIHLVHRALPLIELLKAAAKNNCDVLWD